MSKCTKWFCTVCLLPCMRLMHLQLKIRSPLAMYKYWWNSSLWRARPSANRVLRRRRCRLRTISHVWPNQSGQLPLDRWPSCRSQNVRICSERMWYTVQFHSNSQCRNRHFVHVIWSIHGVSQIYALYLDSTWNKQWLKRPQLLLIASRYDSWLNVMLASS